MIQSHFTPSNPKDRGLELATALWSGLLIVAAVLVSRRLSGALTGQLSSLATSVIATGTTGLSLSAYLLFQWTGRSAVSRPARIAAGVVTLVPPFALGIVLLPGHSPVATSYLLTLLLFSSAAVVVLGDLPFLVRDEPFVSPGESEAELRLATDDGPNSVSQWMTRSVTSEGRERIEGAVKVDFAPGQKQAMIHLPFCPPFFGRPEVECESLDESVVRFKVAAAYPYGARIEAKRTAEAETARTVEVGFTAVASAPGRGAA